jgi:hypothetical protein
VRPDDPSGAASDLPPPRTGIRAQVLLCWLALLLVRIIETKTARVAAVREDLHELHVGVVTGPAGSFTPTSEPATATKAVAAAPEIFRRRSCARPRHLMGPSEPGNFQVHPSRNPPRSAAPSDQDREKSRLAAHAVWCCG